MGKLTTKEAVVFISVESKRDSPWGGLCCLFLGMDHDGPSRAEETVRAQGDRGQLVQRAGGSVRVQNTGNQNGSEPGWPKDAE